MPSLPLHARAHDCCEILADRGIRPPDLALAGGFAREDHLFRALALCSPYARLVCMGRAPMIPGFLVSNIEGVLKPERRAAVHGHWDQLPSSVSTIGTTPETIFAAWEAVHARVGTSEMEKIPFGAIAMLGYADKLRCGLQ